MKNFHIIILAVATFIISNLNAQTPDNLQTIYLNSLIHHYDLTQQDVADVVVSSNHISSLSGVHHHYFRQRLSGIEINQADASAHVLPNGELFKLTSNFIKNPGLKVSGPNSAVITSKQAIEFAAEHLGYTFTEPLNLLQEDLNAVDRLVLYSKGGISLKPIPVHLIYQPIADNALRLAWDLSIDELGGGNWWSVRVDATTGAVIDKNSWTVSCNFEHPPEIDCYPFETKNHVEKEETLALSSPGMVGNYNVYAMPVESPHFGGRTLVANPDNAIASPFGWHDDNGVEGDEYTITRGNNVHAYDDIDANNSGGYSPDGGVSLLFDYPINIIYTPSDPSLDAAITNLFYWSNICHDLWYLYGFDEASGNFQQNNYNNGGVDGDYCQSEAQDGSGTCNANMSVSTDGNPPRMQMYVCGNRDGDLDNGVVVHEYGHGISIRLTGGAGNASCLNNQEQMGEGWSDWFGMMMTIEPGDAGTDSRGMGTWLFGQDPDGPGIRPFPYSTNLDINPHTYDDIMTEAIPHGVGSVWCAMLWEVAWALINDYGYNADFYNGTGGNNIAMALVMEGLKLQPCSPGFVNGRDAILEADAALYGGANECLIWEAFAKRGLGFSAIQGSSDSRSDGTEAFDMPPSCSPLPIELLDFSGIHIPNSGNQLKWFTSSEINNSHFVIERSFDGRKFKALAEVSGKGASNSVVNYNYLDKSTSIGKHYYRLKQVDHGGQFEYSNTIVIETTRSGQNIQVFPNPATNIITLSLSEGSTSTQKVILYNVSGIKVLNQQVELNQNTNFSINLTSLPKGIYYGELVGQREEEPMRFRFVKE